LRCSTTAVAEIITLLGVETNNYYHQFLGNFDDRPSPQCEVTEAEMFTFLALTLSRVFSGGCEANSDIQMCEV
jgi:hypothetical protein